MEYFFAPLHRQILAYINGLIEQIFHRNSPLNAIHVCIKPRPKLMGPVVFRCRHAKSKRHGDRWKCVGVTLVGAMERLRQGRGEYETGVEGSRNVGWKIPHSCRPTERLRRDQDRGGYRRRCDPNRAEAATSAADRPTMPAGTCARHRTVLSPICTTGERLSSRWNLHEFGTAVRFIRSRPSVPR